MEVGLVRLNICLAIQISLYSSFRDLTELQRVPVDEEYEDAAPGIARFLSHNQHAVNEYKGAYHFQQGFRGDPNGAVY